MKISFAAITLAMCLAVAVISAQDNVTLKTQDNERIVYHNAISKRMSSVASKAGLNIDNAGIVYAGSQNGMIVNTGFVDVAKLGTEELARGADVLFVCLSTSDRLAVPSGYYKVRVAKKLGSSWTASFIDLEGKMVATLPATVNTDNVEQKFLGIKTSAGIDAVGPYVDAHLWRFEVKIHINITVE